MDADVAAALEIDRDSGARERTVDITTVGRRSGEARRIETWFYRVDDTVYLSGLPGKRGWAANLEAEPRFTFHLKNGVQADLAARATRVDDEAERRRILVTVVDDLGSTGGRRSLEEWVAGAPLYAVEFDD
jgi:deazaflavin-dependent oxidoreductase (nitroreductase family)